MPDAPRDRMREGYARGRARDEEIRRNLDPLEPGERPGAVTVAAIVAALLCAANTVALVTGETVTGDATASGIGLSVVLLACAVGMWQARYWAVLGFQALLVIQIVAGSALLLGATSWRTAGVGLAMVVLSGWLFWKLIRAMARLQMPER